MKSKQYKKELYKRWDKFSLSEGEQALELSSSLQKFLKNIIEPDAEDYYLWGQSIYTLNQTNVLKNSHPLFIKALAKDKKHFLARLYSAHCFHDKGDYKSALSEYLKVDKEKLKKEMPIWRWVKLLEQIGFCYVKNGQISTSEQYFDSVINAYLTTQQDELVPIQEAYECLSSKHPLFLRLKEVENKYFSR